MRRREFLAISFIFFSLGSALAEPSRVWRVALVSSGAVAETGVVFRRALQSFGYEEGKNLTIDVREAKGRFALLPDLLKQVVDLKPDVIVAVATPAVAAAQATTSSIPIVMSPATDPIGSGFVKSFAHPGGNITGIASLYGDLTAKTLEILHVGLPTAKKIGVLTSNNPTHPPLFEAAKRGATAIGLSAERFTAADPDDLERAFMEMKAASCDAVYVLADPYQPTIPAIALKVGLPVIRAGPGCLNRISASISGASAGVRPPRGAEEDRSRLDPGCDRQGSNAVGGDCRSPGSGRSKRVPL